MAPVAAEGAERHPTKENLPVSRPSSNPPERWLWPHEVAELLSVHPKTINMWSRQGRLPHIRTIGGHRKYPESEILALRARLTVGGAS